MSAYFFFETFDTLLLIIIIIFPTFLKDRKYITIEKSGSSISLNISTLFGVFHIIRTSLRL